MNRYLTTFVASLCLTAASGTITAAQEYVAPQVVVSTDKVRYNGKVYYSHIVQERQTLYSISKAYNVTLQEIYDANPNLHLNTEGLKKDQIILIPIKEGVTQTPTRTTKVETTADNKADSGDDKAKEYTHTDAAENLIELEHVEIGHVRNLHSCVGEGEDRHYQEVDPRAESVLKTVAHSDGVSGDR